MQPPSPSHDAKKQRQQQELLRDARANVGLLADTIWATPVATHDIIYRKLNRDLWTRSCKIVAKYAELQGSVEARATSGRRVRDVIPESRLASYGDFEYGSAETVPPLLGGSGSSDEDAETNGDTASHQQPKEPWMLDEVEEYVAQLKAASRSRRRARQSSTKCNRVTRDSIKTNTIVAPTTEETKNHPRTSNRVDKASAEEEEEEEEAPVAPRYSVTNVSEAQLEGRISSATVRDIWHRRRLQQPNLVPGGSSYQQPRQEQLARDLRRELGLLQRPHHHQAPTKRTSPDLGQQSRSSFHNERLKIPTISSRCQQYPNVQTISPAGHQRTTTSAPPPPPPPLCVDVPEFFPQGPSSSATSTLGSWLEDARKKPPPQYNYGSSASDNPYQGEPYKGHRLRVAAVAPTPTAPPARKTAAASVAVYQNTLMPMVPTPMVSAVVWPSQVWSQRMVPAAIQIHHMAPPSCPTMTPTNQPITALQQPQMAQSTPMCQPVIHRPIRVQEVNAKTSVQHQQQQPQAPSGHKVSQVGQATSGYQRPGKPTASEYNQRRKNQGVDFNNLILLTKSAMKVRRNQTKGSSRKFFSESYSSSSSKSASVAAAAAAAVAAKAEASSTRWFDKGYQTTKREREYVMVNTKGPRYNEASGGRGAMNVFGSAKATANTRMNNDEDEDGDCLTSPDSSCVRTPCSRKRLYRDVLGSSASPVEAIGAVETDKQVEAGFYDELERQAVEQYRTSEESLALKYQELEQQALEQYKTAGSSSDSINSYFESQTASNFRSNEDEPVPVDTDVVPEDDADPECRDCSSGFGKCSPRKKPPVASERGNELQQPHQAHQRIKILKQEGKASTVTTAVAAPVVHRAASEGCLRPLAVARRLKSVASFFSSSTSHARESKNTLGGATDEKIVKSSSLTWLKRQPMPTSLLERSSGKPGASIMRNATLDPLKALQNLDKHVAATYYRNTKVIQTGGGGDDKVNRDAGAWLSDFWS